MLSLLTSSTENPLYLAHYARGLLRRGEAVEAQLWVDRLAKAAPDAFPTLEVKAHLLKVQGKDTEAAALLTTYVEKNKNADLHSVAELLEQLSLADAAEEMYRKFVSQSKEPESILALAQYLGRHNRSQEALDLCERAWQSCSAEAVAATCLTVLYTAKVTDDHCQRIAQQLETGMQQNLKGTSLWMHLADLRNLQGRFQDVEVLYRRILERDQHNVAVLNNLAWLLAFQSGKGAEALDLINKALDLEGPLPRQLDTRAVVYLAAGKSDLAIADLEQAVAEAPTAARYFHLAQAYQMAKKQDAALQAFRKAKTAGLSLSILHPLERTAYPQLQGELDPK